MEIGSTERETRQTRREEGQLRAMQKSTVVIKVLETDRTPPLRMARASAMLQIT